jgi:methionine-S-sulfoxide reductase
VKKIFFLILFFQTSVFGQSLDKAYFAGGCFWCMEESFEKVEGILEVISGYSGGITENPTYEEVTYGTTGHFETIEIVYDNNKINYKKSN